MTASTDKREKALIAKYGSVEKLAEKRREWQAKSRESYVKNGSKGGFRAQTPEFRKQMGAKGGRSRRETKNNRSAQEDS